MFRGRITPLSRFGLQSRGLTGTSISAGFGRFLSGGARGPSCHSMFKTPERKDFPSRQAGPSLADNQPVLFDAKEGQMVSGNIPFSPKLPLWQPPFDAILNSFGPICFGRTARGEVAERLNAAVC
jgi:hypothetical protein